MNTAVPLEQRVKQLASGLGFDPVGITGLGAAATYGAFREWLERGYAGEMAYLSRGAEKRANTSLLYPEARSAIVVGLNYGGRQPAGPIARYARGDDYHDVMIQRLDTLLAAMEGECGRALRAKAYVDTGPILERDLAQRAGLGWIGKNTNLINPERGSFFFLGVLFVDIELVPDAPFEADRCGTCTRCLDACPTQAFVEPRVLDATRCISYLTIENRGEIAPDLRPLVGELVYGCDICQDVCPWNQRFSSSAPDAALVARPENIDPDPSELLALTEAQFRTRFRGSAVKRAKRRGLARNAAIAVGNRRDPADVGALKLAMDDPDSMVRDHARWALEELEHREVHSASGEPGTHEHRSV